MNKMNKVLVTIFALMLFSITVLSATKTTQLTDDISLQEFSDCETIYWDETENVYSTCTNYYNVSTCSDEPFNTSCSVTENSYNYTCKTGTNTVQRSKEICTDKEMRLTVDKLTGTETFSLEYGDWGKCTYETQGQAVVITCDSKYDGNNDGICQPGESCVQFRITKTGVQRLMKNSRYDFVEEDDTFFLQELNLAEVV